MSYYYQYLDAPVFIITPTNRSTTIAETTPQILLPDSSELEVYTDGVFKSDVDLNPNVMTIVLTHGWIPSIAGIGFTDGIDGWPTDTAAPLRTKEFIPRNIVGWNWKDAAKSSLPGTAAARTPDQGIALGQSLLNELGPDYSQPIHFIGHSLGTLVNAYAANYLHGDRWANEPTSPTPWLASNTHMTLFDEAEVATGITTLFEGLDTLAGRNGNPFYPKQFYEHPLPKHFRWADNYVAAFGLLHPEAANVILTYNFPSDAPSPESWIGRLADFHGYPIDWYDETIQADISEMGFLWSFERGGLFSQAPAPNSVYLQTIDDPEWDLTPTSWNSGTNLLSGRFEKYRGAFANSISNQTPGLVSASGSVSGENIVGALPAFNSFLLSLFTTPLTSPAPEIRIQSLNNQPTEDAVDEGVNVPAYTWMSLAIPTDAVSLSFIYKIEGDWKDDSLSAALGGTNVISIPGSQIETNMLFDSGPIDVTLLAGQTTELFIGIVGGTSTDASLTVSNLQFHGAVPPVLQTQFAGGQLSLSWPLWAQDFSLETTTDLGNPDGWTPVTHAPAIVDLENVITIPVSKVNRFYRLRQ